MRGHFLIGGIEIGFVAAGTTHAGSGVVWNEEFADAPEEFKRADVGADPVLQLLVLGSFGVGVVAGSQYGDKERGGELWTTSWVIDGNGISGVVDEKLLAGLVLLAEHHVQVASPTLVEFAQARVAVTVGMILVVLLPPQLQRQMAVGLEFFVQKGKVGDGSVALIDAPRRRPKQGFLQSGLIPAFGQRPADTGRLRSFQVHV